jgi:hypothetical protein
VEFVIFVVVVAVVAVVVAVVEKLEGMEGGSDMMGGFDEEEVPRGDHGGEPVGEDTIDFTFEDSTPL